MTLCGVVVDDNALICQRRNVLDRIAENVNKDQVVTVSKGIDIRDVVIVQIHPVQLEQPLQWRNRGKLVVGCVDRGQGAGAFPLRKLGNVVAGETQNAQIVQRAEGGNVCQLVAGDIQLYQRGEFS